MDQDDSSQAGEAEGTPGPGVQPEKDRAEMDEGISDMEDRAEEMEERSKEVGEEAERSESDWEAKKDDRAVPGAKAADDADEEP